MISNDENIITKGDIIFSFILTRLLFADNYMDSLNSLVGEQKKLVFESMIANIMTDVIFTKFDESVNSRLFDILNYYRDIYKDEVSFEKINDAISVLNKNEFEPNVYPTQFELRYNTIFGNRTRKNFLKKNYEIVKQLVEQSIINDLSFFYDIDKLKGPEFNETYGNDVVSVSNAAYLINMFPEIFNDSMVLIKVHNLLAYNMDCTRNDLKNNAVLYSGSAMTLKKIYKMIKKNK